MCFIKSSKIESEEPQSDIVQRQQADSSLTKTSRMQNSSGYRQNIKTTPVGLEDDVVVQKKTLLGE